MNNNNIYIKMKDQLSLTTIDNKMIIGFIEEIDDGYETIVLKDARLIHTNENLDVNTVIEGCSSIEIFKKLCLYMTTPVEAIIIKNPTSTIILSKDIKQFYKSSTNIDKKVMKEKEEVPTNRDNKPLVKSVYDPVLYGDHPFYM